MTRVGSPAGAAIGLAGIPNLRDLGGYAAAGGRRLRQGRLYRSSALHQLSDDGAPFLALGIRTICDFRSPGERELAPYARPDGCRATVHAIEIVSSAGPRLRALLESGTATAEAYRALLIETYRTYVRDHAGAFRTFFAHLLDDGAYPLLFHCSAGKDRTGMAAALVLTALGVGHDTVIEDYLLTNRHWRGGSPITRSAPADLLPTIVRADEAYLAAAFEAVVADHGSVETFLEGRLGLGPAERHRLQELLLE